LEAKSRIDYQTKEESKESAAVVGRKQNSAQEASDHRNVIDRSEDILQIEHTRHHSFWSFLVNLLADLIAYCWHEKKPTFNRNVKELSAFGQFGFVSYP
jgi:hypothetical protein